MQNPFLFVYSSISFIFGIVVGSFLNVCIVRIPQGQSIVKPRSHCPGCHHLIAWYDNIPLFSYLFLSGRCRYCRTAISSQYFWVELLSGFFAVLCFYKFSSLGMAALWFLSFICPLLVISFIDLKYLLIPDVITLPFIGVGLVTRLVSTHFYFPIPYLIDSLLGIALGAGSIYLIGFLYERIKKREGIGRGDVKLAAMIGAFLGWKAIFVVFLLSSFLGSMVGLFLLAFTRRGLQSAIPYGPFLSLAAAAQLFFGNEMVTAYLQFIRYLLHL